MKITDKRRRWIKSLSPGHMEDSLLSGEERKIWVQSRTPEEMACYLEMRADRLEANLTRYFADALAVDSAEDMWVACQLQKEVAMRRINARRCREGKRLIQRLEDDK